MSNPPATIKNAGVLSHGRSRATGGEQVRTYPADRQNSIHKSNKTSKHACVTRTIPL